MFWKTYVVVLILSGSFQKIYDIILAHMDDVSIYTLCMSMFISVDSILIFLFPVESPYSSTVVCSFSKLWVFVDRCWDINVDRRSSMLSILWLDMIIYSTSCVVGFVCNSPLVLWGVALLHEKILCSISHLKNVCNVLSGYLQCMSIYCSCI